MKTINELQRKYMNMLEKAENDFEFNLIRAEFHYKLKLLAIGESFDLNNGSNNKACIACGC